MSNTLKPCPFCGKPVTIFYSSSTSRFYAVHQNEEISECIIEMPIDINNHRVLFSLEDAYRAWNERND